MKCNKCLKEFNKTLNQPEIIFPCQHIFCSECLSQVETCPTCSNKIETKKLSQDVIAEQLRLNKQELIQHYNRIKETNESLVLTSQLIQSSNIKSVERIIQEISAKAAQLITQINDQKDKLFETVQNEGNELNLKLNEIISDHKRIEKELNSEQINSDQLNVDQFNENLKMIEDKIETNLKQANSLNYNQFFSIDNNLSINIGTFKKSGSGISSSTHQARSSINQVNISIKKEKTSNEEPNLLKTKKSTNEKIKKFKTENLKVLLSNGVRMRRSKQRHENESLLKKFKSNFSNETTDNIKILKGHEKSIFCLALLPNGNLASGSEDKTIRIWDCKTGTTLKILREHTGTIIALAVLPDGTLASGGDDNRIIIWNIFNGNKISQLEGHTDMISCLLVVKNELASGSYDYQIRIWDTENSNKTSTILNGHEGYILSLVNLPNGTLASGSTDKQIRIWNLSSGETTKILTCDCRVFSLACLNDNRLISTSKLNLVIWDLTNDSKTEICNSYNCRALLILLKDKILATGHSDGFIRIWDIEKGVVLKESRKCNSRVSSLKILSDGRLACSSGDIIIKLWDIKSEIND